MSWYRKIIALRKHVMRVDLHIHAGDLADFKDEQLSDGQYMWKVTETTTGISSNPSYFSMAPCEINFSITNDSSSNLLICSRSSTILTKRSALFAALRK